MNRTKLDKCDKILLALLAVALIVFLIIILSPRAAYAATEIRVEYVNDNISQAFIWFHDYETWTEASQMTRQGNVWVFTFSGRSLPARVTFHNGMPTWAPNYVFDGPYFISESSRVENGQIVPLNSLPPANGCGTCYGLERIYDLIYETVTSLLPLQFWSIALSAFTGGILIAVIIALIWSRTTC